MYKVTYKEFINGFLKTREALFQTKGAAINCVDWVKKGKYVDGGSVTMEEVLTNNVEEVK